LPAATGKIVISLHVVGSSSYNPKLIPSCYISKFKHCLLGSLVSLGIKYIDLGKMQEILKVGLECNFSKTSEEHENRLQIFMTKSFICMFLIACTNQ
jgi:hypothetical protein